MDLVSEIDLALETAGRVTASIGADEWAAPTACEGWDVHVVLNHLVGGMHIFAAELAGARAGADHESDWLGDDPLGRFHAAVDADRTAWRRPDALSGTVSISLGTLPGPLAAVVHLTELTVHAVDIAVAVGRERLLDEDQCGRLLALMRTMGMDAYRVPGVFEAEVPVPRDALPHRQLAGYLGRTQRVVV